jgi:hypothetical protein
MKKYLLSIVAVIFALSFTWVGVAAEIVITCANKQGYPTIELKGDATLLSKAGTQHASLAGLAKPVEVKTAFTSDRHNLELTILAANGNQTIMTEVKNSEDASNVWDGAGTLSYGGSQAEADHKALFGGEVEERVMAVQQFSKSTRYPRPGGFCVLSTK